MAGQQFISRDAGGAIAHGRAVIDGGASVTQASAAGSGLFCGIYQAADGAKAAASGDRIRVAVAGDRAKATAGGALTRGTHQLLSYDANGKLVAWTEGARAAALWLPGAGNAADEQEIDVIVLDGQPVGVISGTATITAGGATAVVAVGAAYNGKPVVATLAAADATALYVKHAAVAAGSMTITANANATADTDVHYIIAVN